MLSACFPVPADGGFATLFSQRVGSVSRLPTLELERKRSGEWARASGQIEATGRQISCCSLCCGSTWSQRSAKGFEHDGHQPVNVDDAGETETHGAPLLGGSGQFKRASARDA